MLSCFANRTAKLIRVKDGKVIAYFDASGNSVHMDVITGGKEALTNAAGDLATKITEALNKEGGK
jgi:ArsR family metal-binding transcriptional regulator